MTKFYSPPPKMQLKKCGAIARIVRDVRLKKVSLIFVSLIWIWIVCAHIAILLITRFIQICLISRYRWESKIHFSDDISASPEREAREPADSIALEWLSLARSLARSRPSFVSHSMNPYMEHIAEDGITRIPRPSPCHSRWHSYLRQLQADSSLVGAFRGKRYVAQRGPRILMVSQRANRHYGRLCWCAGGRDRDRSE